MADRPKKPNNSPEITAKKRAEGKDLGGRPPFVIDYEKLEKLCEVFCTGEEIATILGCSRDTLNLRLKQDYAEAIAEDPEGELENRYDGFQACFKKKSATGRASLRHEQFRMAMGDVEKGIKPDKGMLIWLGKNYLGQTDCLGRTTADDALPAASGLDLSLLTEEEFHAFGELIKKANGQEPAAEDMH